MRQRVGSEVLNDDWKIKDSLSGSFQPRRADGYVCATAAKQGNFLTNQVVNRSKKPCKFKWMVYCMDSVFVSENINYRGKKRPQALLHVNTNAAFNLNYLTRISSYNLF